MAEVTASMNRVERVLRELAISLRARGWCFSLVGGLAVSTRSEPRFTRDVDLAVAVSDDAQAETLVHDLLDLRYSLLATVEQDATQRLATARLLPPGEDSGGVVADLLFASSGIEPELTDAAEPIEILPGLTVPVATTGHLIALKVLSAAPERPQDLVDLLALSGAATTADFEVARHALELIQERGFGRNKSLLDEFQRLVVPHLPGRR